MSKRLFTARIGFLCIWSVSVFMASGISGQIFPDQIPNNFSIETLGYADEILARRSEKAFLYAPTKIEMGAQSQLMANPGTSVTIYFEVTNLREQPAQHNFQVVDEMRFLQTLNPRSIFLTPQQTASVVVTAFIPANAEIGSKDKITFSSQGLEVVSQAAYLTVTAASAIQDTTRPDMYWTFGSRCEGKTASGRCAEHFWSLDVTAQDYESGMLRLQSLPKGLFIRNSFTAGSTNQIKATYTSSCCQTKVTLVAYDVQGNQRSATIDVTDIYLTEAAIAAISLGVLLLVALIALIVIGIVWCCNKRKESISIHTYRSRNERASGANA